jgi:hypothetical protein
MNIKAQFDPALHPEAEQREQLERINTAIVEHQTLLVKRGIWRCCVNCDFWDKNRCSKYNAVPPPEVIVHGCRDWEDDIPF